MIVYRLMKYIYIILYKESSTVEDLVQVLLKTVFIYYRVLDEIILDRDKLFISKFWTILLVLLGSKRKLSIVFYSQTDRQTEWMNETIESYLQYYINYK